MLVQAGLCRTCSETTLLVFPRDGSIVFSGFVQFIDSVAVAEVLDKDGSIQNYFKKQAPADGSPYGISPEVMDNYIKSCGE